MAIPKIKQNNNLLRNCRIVNCMSTVTHWRFFQTSHLLWWSRSFNILSRTPFFARDANLCKCSSKRSQDQRNVCSVYLARVRILVDMKVLYRAGYRVASSFAVSCIASDPRTNGFRQERTCRRRVRSALRS